MATQEGLGLRSCDGDCGFELCDDAATANDRVALPPVLDPVEEVSEAPGGFCRRYFGHDIRLSDPDDGTRVDRALGSWSAWTRAAGATTAPTTRGPQSTMQGLGQVGAGLPATYPTTPGRAVRAALAVVTDGTPIWLPWTGSERQLRVGP